VKLLKRIKKGPRIPGVECYKRKIQVLKNGDGTYALSGLGRLSIKKPEFGIRSYLAGKGAWIWDVVART
jgi:hypothetical protein